MGMNGENSGAIVFDLETLPIDSAEEFLESASAPDNYKDPIKIRDYIVAANAKAIGKCSLDPSLCRIAVAGWIGEGGHEPHVLAAVDETAERFLLAEFWKAVSLPGGGHRRTVSFYGLSFDWPVIITRSWLLNVPFSMPDVDKYNRAGHVDLYQRLTFRDAVPSHSLDFFAKRHGVVLPETDMIDGSQTADVIARGDWDTAIQHCRLDVLKTALIAQRIGLLLRDVAVSV